MKNIQDQIIDVTPERVEIVSYVPPKQKVVMLIVATFLVAIAYTFSQTPIKSYPPIQIIQPILQQKTENLPISQKKLKVGDIIPVKGYLKSSVDNTLTALQNSMNKTKQTLDKQQAMHTIETALYKSKMGERYLSEEESRELLLRAGFKPEKQKLIPQESKKETHTGGLELSHTIAKELIRDEVEGFFLKVRLATKVGEYLAKD